MKSNIAHKYVLMAVFPVVACMVNAQRTGYNADAPLAPIYHSLKEFSATAGLEKNGVMLDYDLLVKVEPVDPDHRDRVFQLDEFDFRLRDGSAAIDVGVHLPNITDGFRGSAPNLGAYEHGKPLPHYGP